MPKKKKKKKKRLTEPEIHAMIDSDARIRLGCKDLAPEFTLHRTDVEPTRYPSANWGVRITSNADTWLPDCAQAFQETVARARRKVDIAWP